MMARLRATVWLLLAVRRTDALGGRGLGAANLQAQAIPSDPPRCEPYCVAPCAELQGNVHLECGTCRKSSFACRQGALGWQTEEAHREDGAVDAQGSPSLGEPLRCEPYCVAPCAELQGNVHLECGTCRNSSFACRRGAPGWQMEEARREGGMSNAPRANSFLRAEDELHPSNEDVCPVPMPDEERLLGLLPDGSVANWFYWDQREESPHEQPEPRTEPSEAADELVPPDELPVLGERFNASAWRGCSRRRGDELGLANAASAHFGCLAALHLQYYGTDFVPRTPLEGVPPSATLAPSPGCEALPGHKRPFGTQGQPRDPIDEVRGCLDAETFVAEYARRAVKSNSLRRKYKFLTVS